MRAVWSEEACLSRGRTVIQTACSMLHQMAMVCQLTPALMSSQGPLMVLMLLLLLQLLGHAAMLGKGGAPTCCCRGLFWRWCRCRQQWH